jgi:FAD/FMN-containing dehydrogenase
VPALDDDLITALAHLHAAAIPAAIALRSLGGAFGRVPASATAFAHRSAEAMVVAALILPGTVGDADVERALVPWRAVAARGTGVYVNFQGSATAADVAAAYPPTTLARLAAIKRGYDPDNRFALNHNVKPAEDLP